MKFVKKYFIYFETFKARISFEVKISLINNNLFMPFLDVNVFFKYMIMEI